MLPWPDVPKRRAPGSACAAESAFWIVSYFEFMPVTTTIGALATLAIAVKSFRGLKVGLSVFSSGAITMFSRKASTIW
ncbi:hypothetical protein D3C85_1703760 [compost metagenome]